MKAYFRSALRALASVLLLAPVCRAESPADATSTVSADVGPLRALQGSVACRLYKSPEGFPYATSDTVTVRLKVTAKTMRCTFERVPPGAYVILVHHDENENHQLDKNRLGMPLEGYGVSNNHTHALAAPKWEESKFLVERGKNRELTITLRY
jgi:uncharacterized protein (DUF2141 family)